MTDDFELKRALDALPRAVEPPGDDLWPGIRGKLGAPARGTGAPGHRGTGAPARWRTFVPARPMRIAALLTLLAVSGGALTVMRHNAGQWTLSSAGLGARPFGIGDRFVSGSDSARLTVGTIGTVDVHPGTEVRLLQARWSEHRMSLARGALHARINAPPRLFIVETPSGTAIDLGCEYTLDVDSHGASTLHVTAGWVEFTERGRTALIPAGFRARASRGLGIGTPTADDAPAALVAAVLALDSLAGSDAALAAILANARQRDAVTLWHLLNDPDVTDAQRQLVFTRLAAIAPAPNHGTDVAAITGDAHTMRLWWSSLPGTLPIVPEWQAKLWTLWLRIAG